ncbi:MAG: hypothetical protein Q9195_002974 [Heterodermia aff. obscurata]
MDTGEDVDTSSRPRLTQEQITILEQEFGKLPKPSTDFKKQLADRIGLTLARVNNWYQNRRAKTKNGAKTAEAQFEVRTEDLQLIWPTVDQQFQAVPSYFDTRGSASQSQALLDASPSADYDHCLSNYFGGGNFDLSYESFHGLPEVVPAISQDTTPLAFDHLDFGTKSCPPGITVLSADCKMPVPETLDFDFSGYSSDTPVGFAIPQDSPTEQTGESMYRIVENGLHVGNLSNQTFMSATSSSDGEQANMMTPPERPSPISLQSRDGFDRRSSITGALTKEFQNGFHLQRQSSGQALYDQQLHASETGSISPVHASPSATPVQWNDGSVPSTLSLDTSTDNGVANNKIDLAARRKRPRPAPLIRPDAQRSFSYTGPLTSSPPSARKSLLNPSQPVRRIRSNLDGFSGRVQKPRSTSAHQSPRNVESRFQNAFKSEQSSTTFQPPPTPLSAVHANDESLGIAPQLNDQPHQPVGSPTAFEDSFTLNSPPITPYNVSPFPAERSQGVFLGHAFEAHQPPQSAPPQKTRFFSGDSPPIANSNLGHLSWQAPHELPSNHFAEPNPAVVMQPQYHAAPGPYEQPPVSSTYTQPQVYQNPLQPQLPSQHSFTPPQQLFQPSPEQLYQNAQQISYPQFHSPPMALYHQNVYELQTQPQQLEIKVELGPQPKGPPQPRKQYTFSNSTPDDFSSPKDES